MVRLKHPTKYLLIVLTGLLGCSTEEPDLEVGAPCNASGDCAEPLVCMLEHCHVRCPSVASCPFDTLADGTQVAQRCVQLEGVGVCLATTEQSCSDDPAACAEGLVCGADGACRNDCAISRDCVQGQICTDGICVEPPEDDTEDDAGAPGDDAGAADDATATEDGAGADAGVDGEGASD
jgi:hypothetical protein